MSLLRRRSGSNETRHQPNPLELPSIPLSSATVDMFDDWAGRGNSRRRTPYVTENRALGISAYYRGLSLNSGTLAGIPRAVHLEDGMRDRDLSQIIRMLSNVRADLVVLQHARRKLEWQRAGYDRQPSWGEVYAMGGDGEPEDAA